MGSSLFGDAPHKLVQGTPAPDVTLLVDTTWTYEMALQGIKTGFGDSRIGSGEVCGGRKLAAFVLIMLTGDLLRPRISRLPYSVWNGQGLGQGAGRSFGLPFMIRVLSDKVLRSALQ